MRSTESANGILARIKEAQDDRDWAEVSEILDDANENEVKDLESIIPDLTEHDKWLIRASTVEMIGDFRLKRLVEPVKVRLKDRHPVVRAFALMAYYDLLGAKAMPAIEETCEAGNVGLRFTALALRYVETGDEDALEKFNGILTTRRCHPENRHTAMDIFDCHHDVQRDSEMV